MQEDTVLIHENQTHTHVYRTVTPARQLRTEQQLLKARKRPNRGGWEATGALLELWEPSLLEEPLSTTVYAQLHPDRVGRALFGGLWPACEIAWNLFPPAKREKAGTAARRHMHVASLPGPLSLAGQ